MKLSSLLPLAAVLGRAAHALTPAEWRSQSIYFLLTDRFGRTDNSTTATCNTADRIYCGGSFQGVINHLDYIQGMGFTAIWITPVTGQFYEDTGDGTSYHGYWQQDIYAINPNYGTGADLLALSNALHARGMYLMVDVVANHMGYDGPGTSVDYSVFNPFNSESYFNPYCLISDYTDLTNVEDCWLGDTTVSLPDLNTELSSVQTIWYSWIQDLVANYSIDGLRIDTVLEVQPSFWTGYQAAAGVYAVGEVDNGNPSFVCPFQGPVDGILNYPVYYQLLYAFENSGGSISTLVNMIASVAADCSDPTLLGNFIENHDNPRFAYYTSDYSLAKNVLSFIFLSDGIPIVYAGQEQHYSGGNDPSNREATWLSGYSTTAELYVHTQATNAIRKLIISKDASWTTSRNDPFYQDSNTVAMLKGSTSGSQVLTVLSNLGASGSSYTLTLSGTGYAAGASLIELYTCTTVTADSSGNVPVAMASGVPRVLVPAAWVAGSGLCGTTITTGTTTTTTGTGDGCPATTATTGTTTSKTTFTTSTTTSKTTTTTTACTAATAVPVLFKELVTTVVGQNVYLSGSISQLGTWAPASAILLSASAYTSSNPLWSVTVSLPAGTSFEYKFIIIDSSGTVTWESGSNLAYTVPTGCSGVTATVTGSW